MASEKQMNWAQLSNILHKTGSWKSFAIVSAELWTEGIARTPEENRLKTSEFVDLLKREHFPVYIPIMGNYDAKDERSFIIPNISLAKAVELGKFGDQISVIYGIRRPNVDSSSINVDKGETLYSVRMPLVQNPSVNDEYSHETVWVELNPRKKRYYSQFMTDVLEKWSFRIFEPEFEVSNDFVTYEHQTNINLNFLGSED